MFNRTIGNDSSNNINNNHRRQLSEGIISTDTSNRQYKDDDRHLIQYLVNEYLLDGSNEILDLIRNCSNECFEALVDSIWNTTSQTMDRDADDNLIYNQRSSLLSSFSTNVYRQAARRRLAIILIEIFKLLATPTSYGGRFDFRRQTRLILVPSQARQLINYEPDIHGLSCVALASIMLINPAIIHHQITFVINALKHAANQFLKANLSFETPSTFAISIYSLFYLLYILYPNVLRRELQPESIQPIGYNEKPVNHLGIEKVLLPLCYHFKLHPNIVCSSIESEKSENRWNVESFQRLIANGDRYVVLDDTFSLVSNDFRKRKEEELKKNGDPNRFEIGQIIQMCNEYTESVLHPSETKSQIVKNTIEKQYGRKHSTDTFSNYSDSYCQTYEQQWQTTIQNGQMNLLRAQTSDELNRRQNSNNNNNNNSNGTATKKESSTNNSNPIDHNIHAKVQLQLDMLDCNYEKDKREYYANLIRDFKKTISNHDLDKELRNQETQYNELMNVRQQKCPTLHTVRHRINDFHNMNEAFYSSLSDTQAELKTNEDNHIQKRSSLIEKQSKLKNEFDELDQDKILIENEVREIQRRSFESKQNAKQSVELRDTIDKLLVELTCARKKHQLLHNALVNVKLKSINTENLIMMEQNNEEYDHKDLSTLDEKKNKFDQYKQLIDKQRLDLITKRNNFHQMRNMYTHKISTIRRQIDSVRVCQTQLNIMNTNSQIIQK